MKTLARPRDKAEILRRLREVRPDSLPRWGRMSAHQMVCHVGDCFRMATGDKLVSDPTGVLGRAIAKTIIRWIALYLPLPWPRTIVTRPELDQARQGTRPVEFLQDVAQVEALLDAVTVEAKRFAPVHPIFGRMSQAAWRRWGYLHTDHHLRQFGA